MLNIENLSFAYRRRGPKVLDAFSIDLKPGHVYGLLGRNGVGKSTLLHLISGLLYPHSGSILFKGMDCSRRLPAVLQDVFLVPEEFELPAVSLQQFIKLNAAFYPRFSLADMQTYLNFFEMDMNLHLGALSMGQKKKVFMSFALATHTSLLLMDEPTNGLDIPAKSQFRKFITSGMSDDRLVIISTHQVRDIDKLLDGVIVMDNSQVLLNQLVADITAKLSFKYTDDASELASAFYALPSLVGTCAVLPNTEGEETEINLELLFGAVLNKPNEIAALFHS